MRIMVDGPPKLHPSFSPRHRYYEGLRPPPSSPPDILIHRSKNLLADFTARYNDGVPERKVSRYKDPESAWPRTVLVTGTNLSFTMRSICKTVDKHDLNRNMSVRVSASDTDGSGPTLDIYGPVAEAMFKHWYTRQPFSEDDIRKLQGDVATLLLHQPKQFKSSFFIGEISREDYPIVRQMIVGGLHAELTIPTKQSIRSKQSDGIHRLSLTSRLSGREFLHLTKGDFRELDRRTRS